jgi:tRNA pseudouridine synthase 10
MQLCEICNPSNFQIGECYVCEGATKETDRMIDEALQLLKGVENFSISTIIPKDWLVREEKIWDLSMENAQSIKNKLNRKIVASLAKKYDTDGDVRIIFDYSTKRVTLQNNDLFVFGRYKKLVPGLSQSRWICQKCSGKGCKECEGKGKHYESVEERIGEPMKKAAEASDYVLHASGREDVDATNTAGRIFVMMFKNPKNRNLNLDEISQEIKGSNEVEVSGLKIVRRRFVELVTESHFDKTYSVEVEFENETNDDDTEKIVALTGKTIAQQTPKRVAHRRANLVRHRKIKKIEVREMKGKHAKLVIQAEAGTYIKELISGDDGRTKPNISEILQNQAKCTALDVSEIDDQFIDQF